MVVAVWIVLLPVLRAAFILICVYHLAVVAHISGELQKLAAAVHAGSLGQSDFLSSGCWSAAWSTVPAQKDSTLLHIVCDLMSAHWGTWVHGGSKLSACTAVGMTRQTTLTWLNALHAPHANSMLVVRSHM
jgi:hypothetical protein